MNQVFSCDEHGGMKSTPCLIARVQNDACLCLLRRQNPRNSLPSCMCRHATFLTTRQSSTGVWERVQRTWVFSALAHDEGKGARSRVHDSQKSHDLTYAAAHVKMLSCMTVFVSTIDFPPTVFDFAMWFKLITVNIFNRNFSEPRKSLQTFWCSFYNKLLVTRLR